MGSIYQYSPDSLKVLQEPAEEIGGVYVTPRSDALAFGSASYRAEEVDGRQFVLRQMFCECWAKDPLRIPIRNVSRMRPTVVGRDAMISLFIEKARRRGRFVAMDISELLASFRDFSVLPASPDMLAENNVARTMHGVRVGFAEAIRLLNEANHMRGHADHDTLLESVFTQDVRTAIDNGTHGSELSSRGGEFFPKNSFVFHYLAKIYGYLDNHWIRVLQELCREGFLRPVMLNGKLGYELTQQTIDAIIAASHRARW